MADQQAPPAGPDLSQGIAASELSGTTLLGHVGDEEVLLVRSDSLIFAIDAHCSHYHGPLAEGLVTAESIRCPWHHACFDLRTEARAPALNPLVWNVEQNGDRIRSAKAEQPRPRVKGASMRRARSSSGGGAAALPPPRCCGGRIIAAASSYEQRGRGPADRPNLSKDYPAGSAPEDRLPLRRMNFTPMPIDSQRSRSSLDTKASAVVLADGKTALTTAAGDRRAVRLPIPGADQPHVHTLRSLADCRAIIAAADCARRAVVIGASFIGLETAASLRARDIEVHVVGLEARPMERVLGPEMGDFVRSLHEEHGVIFHLGDTVTAIDGKRATLKSGGWSEADVVVVGRVRPRLALAEKAGLAIDRGVTVVHRLARNQRPRHYAAGDIARWPDVHSGENIRVEHWVVAEPARAKLPRATCWAARGLRCRAGSSGASITMCRSICRPRREVGRNRHRRQYRREGLPAEIQEQRRVLAVASIYDLASLEAELADGAGAA
jgi:nitrite reductase/ring-hydroxylating ferredoxin subunit